MTTPQIYGATPSAIASRLLTPDATVDDRILVEAMVERALQLVAAATPLMRIFLVDRKIASAIREVLKQDEIRMARLAKVLGDLQTVGDDTDEESP